MWEERIVTMRKELADLGARRGGRDHPLPPGEDQRARCLGLDHLAGAESAGLRHPPAAQATEELLAPFAYEFPNECWQADVTHVEVADGVVFEVLNVIDDHSRLCVASRAFVTVTRSPTWCAPCTRRLTTWGYPAALS